MIEDSSLLQEMSVGSAVEYVITALDASEYPEGATDGDKLLVNEALKGAQTVLVYNLGAAHSTITDALDDLKTELFNVLCYPYDSEHDANKLAIATWIEAMRDYEGMKVQAVLANYDGDYEGIINVTQGLNLLTKRN